MSGTTVQVTKDNAYTVLCPGESTGAAAAATKVNAYTVLIPGEAKGAACAVTKNVVYFVLDSTFTPEVWTGNFGTGAYANPAPSGFGAWGPPST